MHVLIPEKVGPNMCQPKQHHAENLSRFPFYREELYRLPNQCPRYREMALDTRFTNNPHSDLPIVLVKYEWNSSFCLTSCNCRSTCVSWVNTLQHSMGYVQLVRHSLGWKVKLLRDKLWQPPILCCGESVL